jgi:hypothetical protein
MKRLVGLCMLFTFALAGCVVVGAPPGQAKKAVGVQSAAELKADGAKVKVKAK